MRAALLLTALSWLAQPATAHHSYAGFDIGKTLELRGTLTAIQWVNPHILLTVNDGSHDFRIEWITTTGADKTAVDRTVLSPGDRIEVTASPHRSPGVHELTAVRELALPDKAWRWTYPGTFPGDAKGR